MIALLSLFPGFPGGSDGKESACNAGDPGSIPGLGRSPGKGNGDPLQYSCLKNSMDRGAWRATVHGVAKSRTLLSSQHRVITYCIAQGTLLSALRTPEWQGMSRSEGMYVYV